MEMEITYCLITAMDSTLPPLICSYTVKYIFSSRRIVCIYGTMELYSDRVTIGVWQLTILHRGTRVAGTIFLIVITVVILEAVL